MNTIRRKTLSLLLVASLLVGIVGIANVETTYAASKKIHLKKTKVTLVAGKTYQQKLIDKKGKTIKASKVKWKSSKKSVAKISKKGKITAVKAGTAKMTAKYKGKTYKFTVKVKKAQTNYEKIYNYVKNNGSLVNSDFTVPGNRCIESEPYYGSDYTDVYIISIDTSDNSKIFLNSYRVKPAPGKYKDTTETTTLSYGRNSTSGNVSFWQTYYINDRSSSWSHFTSSGVIKYADYVGASYYDNETGISNITIGDDHSPVEAGSYESNTLINGTKGMLTGVDKLLRNTFNVGLRGLGFTNL